METSRRQNELMIAVTFALPAESSEFLSRLRNKSRANRNGTRIIRGNIDDREIHVLHTGVGERVCRQRVGKFLEDQQFDLLISTGFAGALNDQLQIGDLLLAKNFSTIDLNEKRSFSTLASEITLRAHRGQPRWIWKRNSLRALALRMGSRCSRCASLPIPRANRSRLRPMFCSTSNSSELTR